MTTFKFFLANFVLEIHKAGEAFGYKSLLWGLTDRIRYKSSLRPTKTISNSKSCALNLISLKIHAFKQIYEFWRLKSVNFLWNLGKFANFCLNSSLRGDKVAETIHYAGSAFKSPLPCGGGWGWVDFAAKIPQMQILPINSPKTPSQPHLEHTK